MLEKFSFFFRSLYPPGNVQLEKLNYRKIGNFLKREFYSNKGEINWKRFVIGKIMKIACNIRSFCVNFRRKRHSVWLIQHKFLAVKSIHISESKCYFLFDFYVFYENRFSFFPMDIWIFLCRSNTFHLLSPKGLEL